MRIFGKFAGGPSGDDGPGFEIVDGQALGQGYLKAFGTEPSTRSSVKAARTILRWTSSQVVTSTAFTASS